jgi:hypothetical protein
LTNISSGRPRPPKDAHILLVDRCLAPEIAREISKMDGLYGIALTEHYDDVVAQALPDVAFLAEAGDRGWARTSPGSRAAAASGSVIVGPPSANNGEHRSDAGQACPGHVGDHGAEEVFTLSKTPQPSWPLPVSDVISTEDLVRRQGGKPFVSMIDLCEVDHGDGEEEHEAFLEDLYTSRDAMSRNLDRSRYRPWVSFCSREQSRNRASPATRVAARIRPNPEVE